jgi:DNA polymerase I
MAANAGAEIEMAQDAGGDELFLVDGSGYIFRAFYALPQNLTNPQGVPVGAVLGFTNMLTKLLTDLHAPFIAVVFDAARKNYRNDIYPEYKANRSETPPDLIPQFPLIREATEAFGIPALEIEGFEADDLIATYARLAQAEGKKVVIVSSDKDLMQLVNENVRLYDPIKNRFMGRADVIEKFGVPPEMVIDVQALAGDPTDNVPGVPGIGIKTAAQLITEYGTLENLLAKAGDIKQPKRREALVNHAEAARISKKLVTLHDDATVPLALAQLRTRDPLTPKLNEFLNKQGFRSVLTRLSAIKPDTPMPELKATAPVVAKEHLPTVTSEYTLINDMAVLRQWIARAHETGFLAIDTETTGLTPAKADLVGISLSTEVGRGAYIPVGHISAPTDLFSTPSPQRGEGGGEGDIKQLPLNDVIAALKPILEDDTVLKIGHNIKYDWQMLAAHGIEMKPCDDTMLISYVLDGSSHGHGMDELAEILCGHTTIKYDDVTGTGKKRISFDRVSIPAALNYAAEDAEITLRLHTILKPRLAQEKMMSVYEDIERPLIPVIARMEMNGIKVDIGVLKDLSRDFGERLAVLEAEIHQLAGHPFNVASPKQMGAVLFDELGLQGGSKTKTGEWSTAVDVLEDLAEKNVIVRKILDWRQLAKLKSTYSDTLQEEINPKTGRVHTSFHMTGTSTGRLASSDPNLQNIPIKTEEGRKIRAAFVANEGCLLLSVDYSQVELRLAAEMAGVAALKQAFKDKVDIHTLTASQVFGVPLDQVTPELRRSAKAVNFGIIYGISGWGLAKQLGCPPPEANDFIRRYLARFPEISTYMEAKKDEARRFGFVRTLYGRKIFIANINSKTQGWRAGAERQAINAPLQGTAADIMKKAMARLPAALDKAGLKAGLLLQVHDELVIEAPENEAEETARVVRDVMENVAALGVPLDAEAGSARSWAAAH